MQKLIKSDCKYLKTKKSHIPDLNKPDGWRTNASKTGSYWCTKSMRATGPDDYVVTPEDCQLGRSCFIPTDF